MGQRQPAEAVICVKRLHVAQNRLTGGGITVVANGGIARHGPDYFTVAEDIADKPHRAMRMEAIAIIGNDTGGFLPAMLQGVKAERGQRRRVLGAIDAENATFVMKLVWVVR